MHALPESDPARPRRPSPVAQPARFDFGIFEGGDDMVRARSFCDDAQAEMNAIIAADRDTKDAKGRDPHWLCDRLTTIQQGAKRARARSVYRSAQDVMGLIHCNGPHLPIDWGQVDGRLLALNKLIGQYAKGVEEVELACPAPSISVVPARDPMADFRQQRDTLQSLLPHARPEERQALQRLMDGRFAPATTDDDAHAAQPAAPRFALEDALPDLVQRLLGHGRDYGKTLSVSYALDGVALGADARDALIERLWERLSERIASDMPLQGIGHLDIMAEGHVLQISGSGFAPFAIDFDAAPATSARPAPAAPKRARPAPRITPDTEDDLRAQLNALLDGGGHSA